MRGFPGVKTADNFQRNQVRDNIMSSKTRGYLYWMVLGGRVIRVFWTELDVN